MNAVDVLKALGITIDLFNPSVSPADQIKVAKEKVLELALENSPYRDTYNFLANTEKLLGLSNSAPNIPSSNSIPVPRPSIFPSANDNISNIVPAPNPVAPKAVEDTNITENQIPQENNPASTTEVAKKEEPKDPNKKVLIHLLINQEIEDIRY